MFETEFIRQFLKAGNLARCSWPKDVIYQTLAVIRDLSWAMTLSCFSHTSDRWSTKSGSKFYKQLLKKSDIPKKRRKAFKSFFKRGFEIGFVSVPYSAPRIYYHPTSGPAHGSTSRIDLPAYIRLSLLYFHLVEYFSAFSRS